MVPKPTQPRLVELETILKNLTAKADTEHDSLLIAIDFGTTYSGVGYCFTSQPSEIYTITSWPSFNSTTTPCPKVPTVVKYENSGSFKWGFEVESTEPCKIEGFKRLLDSSLPTPLHITSKKITGELKKHNKTPKDVTRDFLIALYDYSLEWIESKNPTEFLKTLEFKFILSFPAEWPEGARKATLEAVKDFGVGAIIEIGEPLAAAVHSLSPLVGGDVSLKSGDVFTVCDAGGGTVDLLSYKVRSTKPLKVEATVKGTGGFSGSLMLNKAFENFVGQAVDEEEFVKLKKTNGYKQALKNFEENIKPKFSMDGPATYRIQFLGARLTPDAGMKLETNALTMTKENMKNIFQPLCKEIADFIQSQITQVELKSKAVNPRSLESVKAVLLVGGFGSSPYLKQHVQKTFPKLKVLQPENAWTAVCRGALLHNLPPRRVRRTSPSVSYRSETRLASKHYGIACSPIFDPVKHKGAKKYWDSFEGQWRCEVVNWVVNKNNDLFLAKSVKIPCYKECAPFPEIDDFDIRVVVKESSNAQAPTFSSDQSLVTNCTINTPLNSIPIEQFKRRTRSSDGQEYWELFYEINVEVKNGLVTIWVEIDGVEYSKRGLAVK